MIRKLLTWYRLGYQNVIAVAVYRLLKKTGYYRRNLPIVEFPGGAIFSDEVAQSSGETSLDYFSFHAVPVSSPPNWFLNPWNGAEYSDTTIHWSATPDFMPELGDIKLVWELSRFDWVPRMAWRYRQGEETALPVLESWLRDWSERNPVNGGINWKCGQETSLRCLNLLLAALCVDETFDEPSPTFLNLLDLHGQRIVPTLRYAMAQDNNHGTSEAAALFVVGQYLIVHGDAGQQRRGKLWLRKGRFWLENRVARLILSDGSFSQNSVSYHRLMLDALSFAELMRQRFGLPEFSQAFYSSMASAVCCLYQFVDALSGDAPNLGANDGALLFNLDEGPYRDFRPSVQLGAAVFMGKAVWASEVRHPLLELFGVDLGCLSVLEDQTSVLMDKGGYAILRNEQDFAMLRLPIYRFRPGHADALHLDVWHKGMNVIRDAGSYSYNADEESQRFFPGTESHSTVCFDDRDQMPRLGRFLFGSWLKPDILEFVQEAGMVKSAYTDYLGARHIRESRKTSDGWCVIDEVAGFEKEAVIRWRLAPLDWKLDGLSLSVDDMSLVMNSDMSLDLKLIEQAESRYYMHRAQIPVLEVRCSAPGRITTEIRFCS